MLYIKDDNDFDIKGASVVKFSAEWCAPCKKMETLINKMEKEFHNIKFFDVDVDKCNMLAKKYKVKSLPTLIFFIDKKEKNRITGAILTEPLRKILKEFNTQGE